MKAKFYVAGGGGGGGGGYKIDTNGLGHMMKMVTMPIYGKNLKTSSPELIVL